MIDWDDPNGDWDKVRVHRGRRARARLSDTGEVLSSGWRPCVRKYLAPVAAAAGGAPVPGWVGSACIDHVGRKSERLVMFRREYRAYFKRLVAVRAGMMTAGQLKYRDAILRAAVPPLDLGTYLDVTPENGFKRHLALYPGGVRVSGVAGLGQRVGGGVRGVITGKSRQARRRQMAYIARLRFRDGARGHFVTLTLPDSVLVDGVAVVYPRLKVWLDTFKRRVLRRWPDAFGLWALEIQDRKSGDNKGLLMPHVHILLWGVGDGLAAQWRDKNLVGRDYEKSDEVLRLQAWCKNAWARVVGANGGRPDQLHARRGADVVALDSRRAVYAYVAKYTGKHQAGPVDEKGAALCPGRWWGVWNKESCLVEVHEGIKVPVTDFDVTTLKRLAKKWLRARRTGRSGKNQSAAAVAAGSRENTSARRYAARLARQNQSVAFWLFAPGLGLGDVPGDDGDCVAFWFRILDSGEV